jgi:hypothetical protein
MGWFWKLYGVVGKPLRFTRTAPILARMLLRARPIPSRINVNGTPGISAETCSVWLKGNIDSKFAR